MVNKYNINIDENVSKENIKKIIPQFTDIYNNFLFKDIEIAKNKNSIYLNITIYLKKIIEPDFFIEFLKYLKKYITNEVKIHFLIKEEKKIDFLKKYWRYFLFIYEEYNIWLEDSSIEIENEKIYIIFEDDFKLKKIKEEKFLRKFKKEFKEFFDINYDIKFKLKNELKTKINNERNIKLVITEKESFKSEVIKNKISGKVTPINNIIDEKEYIVEGRIFFKEDNYKKKLKGKNKFVFDFYLTDESDTIRLTLFVPSDDGIVEKFETLKYARVKIATKYSDIDGEITGVVKYIQPIERKEKEDLSKIKRIELHAHTKMSAMDSVMDIEDYIKQVSLWGHPAFAITDHGVVHSFPKAYSIAKKYNIKFIMGIEGYIVNTSKNYKQNKSYHIIILVKNKTGLKNLYRLVSESHINYFYKKPRIPKDILNFYRGGLLLGTACYLGELYQAILNKYDEKIIEEIIAFYDYLEIQPIENNKFLINEKKVKDIEELKNINKKIYEYGKKYKKPVVATGDVHFLKKEDKIYREVIMLAQGYNDIEETGSADLSLKTTDEMLKEFEYLGKEECFEVVIKNPALISDMIESNIEPVPYKLYTPTIENSDEEIKKTTYSNAYKIYGENLPDFVEKRIQKELEAIIKNKYSVLYLIAKKMVDKSLEAGYVVGSRGSVGSSIVAYLCGISEVNPLPPHYLCESCKYVEVIKTDLTGVDLKDKDCPLCGKNLKKDGFNIPFETFMGFKGEKVPDIDLNFSGNYQEEIHKFVEKLFGKDHVFRAGTIVTMQEQAIKKDFLNKYIEKTKKVLKNAEKERLAKGCAGIKRSTGQHAGGLMLVPQNMEIYDFTPIQYTPKKDAITTHFDYKQLHEAMIKIDALGHDLPTSLKWLSEELNIDIQNIPLDDKKTMKIFSDISCLGVNPENYEIPIGTLGVPEYGTKLTRQILLMTKPKTFTELVYVAGLSHGTEVWLGNAKDLIETKKATLREVISVRDDIMNFLIDKGIKENIAFEITEKVRKGKGLTEEHKKIMKKHKVPDWYINSCSKIKYLFPKAHAVAYAIMSFRFAYVKVHYPIYFYADFFNREKNGFKYDFLFMDTKEIKTMIKNLKLKKRLDKKESDQLKVLEVMFEMKERGFDFLNIDIDESDPFIFKVKNKKVLPPLTVIPELGEKVAKNIAIERAKKRFTSLEDIIKRTKINKNVSEFIKENKIINLPLTDQIILF